MSKNLQFMASYTLAKGNNTVSSMWDGAADSNRLEDEYGPSTADRRHRLVFSGITTALPSVQRGEPRAHPVAGDSVMDCHREQLRTGDHRRSAPASRAGRPIHVLD
jgi:hypothetical protein